MDRKLSKAERYIAVTVITLRKWQVWIPLALAGLTLLAGLLPVAGVPSKLLHVNAYGIPSGMTLVQFLLFPAVLAVTWLLEKFAKNFDRFAKGIYAIAAAVQVVSVFFLSSAAGRHLIALLQESESRPELRPQRLGAGFYCLLVPAVAFLLYSGVRVLLQTPAKPQGKDEAPVYTAASAIAVPVEAPAAGAPLPSNYGQNPTVYSR